jgi:hypothetical protein
MSPDREQRIHYWRKAIRGTGVCNGVQWERGKLNGKALKEIDKALAKKNTTPKKSEHSDELGQKMKLDRRKPEEGNRVCPGGGGAF